MEDSTTILSRSWGFSYSTEKLSDSFHIGNMLHDVFEDIDSIQWITVLQPARDKISSCWECWVSFPTPLQRIELVKLMLGPLDKPLIIPTVVYSEEDHIPIDIVCLCIEGNPYVQHNVPMDWRRIAKNVSNTRDSLADARVAT